MIRNSMGCPENISNLPTPFMRCRYYTVPALFDITTKNIRASLLAH